MLGRFVYLTQIYTPRAMILSEAYNKISSDKSASPEFDRTLNAGEAYDSSGGNANLDNNSDGGYNDINDSLRGGEISELYNQGTVGRNSTQERRTGHKDTGRNSQNGRGWQETKESFAARAQSNSEEAGRGKRVYVDLGNTAVSYTEKQPDNSHPSNAAVLLKRIGVNAVYCEGPIEINNNGVTTIHTNAVTLSDGSVYVSSLATLSDVEISYHENVHVNDYMNTEAYADYEAVVCDNIDYQSKNYKDTASQINDNHYGGKYDIDDPSNAAKFTSEITAYIVQFVATDPEFAEQTFAPMFKNWEEVKAAAEKFNSDTKADSIESASFVEGKSIFNEPSVKTLNYSELSEGQKEVVDIGKQLGWTVKFESVFAKDENGRARKDENGNYIRVEGKVNALTKVIYIDYNCKEPIKFVFKHELSHYIENSKSFEAFKQSVLKSKAFKNWLKRKGLFGDSVQAMMDEQLSNIKGTRAAKGVPVSDIEAECEMIANFVGDNLFTDNFSDLASIIKNADTKERGTIRRVLHDFISFIKKKLSGNRNISFEISRLEDSFAKMFAEADNVADGVWRGEKYLFAGLKAANVDKDSLKIAKERIKKGESSERVRQDTGWFQGYDGKWRYEINDRGMIVDLFGLNRNDPDLKRYRELYFKYNVYKARKRGDAEYKRLSKIYYKPSNINVKLEDIISHPKLFEAYPQLKKIKIVMKYMSNAYGASDLTNKRIFINPEIIPDQLLFEETIVHEIQHFIQGIEGFAKGTNPDFAGNFYNYINSAGEIEANDVKYRLNLTDEERKEVRPNIDDPDVVFAGGDINYSIAYTTDNKPVAVIDEDILDGVPKSQWIQTVKNTISNKFSKGIPISGRLIKVNKITRSEYTNSKYIQYLKSADGTMYRDKLKAANNLDDIFLASTNYINEDLKHERKDSFKEFARGDVLIRVGENDYSAKVIIGFTGSKQMVLYDVVAFNQTSFDIKEKTSQTAMQNAGSDRYGMSPNTTVPQKEQSVNSNISENEERYSFNDEKADSEKSFEEDKSTYHGEGPGEKNYSDSSNRNSVRARSFEATQYDEAKAYRDDLVNSDTKADSIESASFVEGKSIFNEPSVKTLNYSELSEGQKEVVDIGKQLGWTVKFESVFAKDENGRARKDENGNYIRAEGKVNALTKVIYIDYNCKKPIKFVFIHELADFLSKNYTAKYFRLMRKIMRSGLFKNYITAKGYKSIFDYNKVICAQRIKNKDPNFTKPGADTKLQANIEMVSDFCGEHLFSDEGGLSRLVELIKGEPQGKNFIGKILDFLKMVGNKLTGKNNSAKESISNLEREFAKLYRQIDNDDNVIEPTVGERYSIGFSEKNNTTETKQILSLINDSMGKISDEEVFDVVDDNSIESFPKKSDYIIKVFNDQENIAHNPVIGDVELSKSGAKSTIMHGFGREKLAAIKAIKPVIENGNIISKVTNYNGTNVDRYIIAAKGVINGEKAIVGVVVKSYPTKNGNSKFYLHEAEIIETDLPVMTAPQLSVDTVSKSVSDTTVPQKEQSVNSNISENRERYSFNDEKTNSEKSFEEDKSTYHDVSKYPYNMQTVIKEYISSVDKSVENFIKTFNENQHFARHKISNVTENQAADIKRLLGIDVSGFTNAINTNAIRHIEKRHGKNGIADSSMSNILDIARIGYVLKNYDNVEIAKNELDEVNSSEFRNAKNEPATMIVYSKKIDGTYYVAQAIPDSEYKKLWIVSAYISKKRSRYTSSQHGE